MNRWALVANGLVQLVGLVVFLHGFLVTQPVLTDVNSLQKLPLEPSDRKLDPPILLACAFKVGKREILLPIQASRCPQYTGIFDKMVFVVVDALRADFVLSETNQHAMPYIWSLLTTGKALGMSARAHSPTVTMPRIKAMTSGSIPGFLDVIVNLQSTEMTQDNWITQARNHNLSLVFHGDDTWLRLFPDHFLRSNGTTSFFVTDFTEVDNNVTYNLDNELLLNDWSILILHYLGLDHIGHVYGPRSTLIHTKLQEMDHIVKRIHEKQDQNTLIVVCGDHGMAGAGSHGGSTDAEVTVPLVFISDKIKTTGIYNTSVYQVDLAVTLSVLMGLPIPYGSVGKLLYPVLNLMNQRQQLYALHANLMQLLTVAGDTLTHSLKDLVDKLRLHTDWNEKNHVSSDLIEMYQEALKEVQALLCEAASEYIMSFMVVGLLLILHQWVLTLVVWKYPESINNRGITGQIIIAALSFLSVYFASEILWFCITITLVFVWINIIVTKLSPKETMKILPLWSVVDVLVLLGTLVHAFSLGGSSFIEEEHQTWYFMVPTILLMLIWNNFKRKGVSVTNLMAFLPILVLHRIARTWNQTGDKWAHLPDFSDWFALPDNITYLWFIMAISLVIICGIRIFRNPRPQHALTILCSVLIFYQKFLNDPKETQTMSQIIYLLILINFICVRELVTVWVLLTALLLRPHNLLILAVALVQEKLWSKVQISSVATITLLYQWMGMATFFYFGNSHSLAKIDLAAGYVGLTNYHPVLVGMLLFAHTFCGPILWLFLLIERKFKSDEAFCEIYSTMQWSRGLVLIIYLTVVFVVRHHLFVWTVFTPKLLYEVAITLCSFIVITISCFLSHMPTPCPCAQTVV